MVGREPFGSFALSRCTLEGCVLPLRFARFLTVRRRMSGDLPWAIPNQCSEAIATHHHPGWTDKSGSAVAPFERVAKKELESILDFLAK